MRIKVLYRKNLKMTEGKLAAQVAHAVSGLGFTPLDKDIIVLGVSDTKFDNELQAVNIAVQVGVYPVYRLQIDKGLTEIPEGTKTCFAYIEEQ